LSRIPGNRAGDENGGIAMRIFASLACAAISVLMAADVMAVQYRWDVTPARLLFTDQRKASQPVTVRNLEGQPLRFLISSDHHWLLINGRTPDAYYVTVPAEGNAKVYVAIDWAKVNSGRMVAPVIITGAWEGRTPGTDIEKRVEVTCMRGGSWNESKQEDRSLPSFELSIARIEPQHAFLGDFIECYAMASIAKVDTKVIVVAPDGSESELARGGIGMSTDRPAFGFTTDPHSGLRPICTVSGEYHIRIVGERHGYKTAVATASFQFTARPPVGRKPRPSSSTRRR